MSCIFGLTFVRKNCDLAIRREASSEMVQPSDNLGDASSHHPNPPRLLWLDMARTTALGGMIAFHAVRDMEMFALIPAGTTLEGFWAFFARLVAASFLFLSGMSLYLAHGESVRLGAWARRFAVVVGAAVLVSLTTRLIMPHAWIWFGILHAIAVASLVGLAFLRMPPFGTASVGFAVLAISLVWGRSLNLPVWTAWTGLGVVVPSTLDYIPLVPWLAPFLFGIAFAQLVNPARFETEWRRPPPRILTLPGQHSLLVYLVHQPILIAIFAAYAWLLS